MLLDLQKKPVLRYNTMISWNSHQHEAEYDDDGNIILPSEIEPQRLFEGQWTVIEDDTAPLAKIEEKHERASRRDHVSTVPHQQVWQEEDSQEITKQARNKLFSVAKNIFQEGADQYSWSISSCQKQCTSMVKAVIASRKPLWSFLAQPVWVVNKKSQKVKQYNRLTLFLLDTVRFGGTFATIFALLFVTLNYQSFWKITQSHLNPIRRVQLSMSRGSVDEDLKQKLLKSPSLSVAGSSSDDLLSFLPEVGPPDNRMIIPKLNLNVPLITPSYQSLLNEDWTKLEEDIQDALALGVVHYPGTARPGQAGNFFVTGHSSYYPWAPGEYKTVFARLHELEVGDEYWVYYGGDKHRYVVQDKKEVKPSNVNVLDQPVGKRISTLMTCTPVGTTLRRLIVTSLEVDPITGSPMEVGQHETRPDQQLNIEALPI